MELLTKPFAMNALVDRVGTMLAAAAPGQDAGAAEAGTPAAGMPAAGTPAAGMPAAGTPAPDAGAPAQTRALA